MSYHKSRININISANYCNIYEQMPSNGVIDSLWLFVFVVFELSHDLVKLWVECCCCCYCCLWISMVTSCELGRWLTYASISITGCHRLQWFLLSSGSRKNVANNPGSLGVLTASGWFATIMAHPDRWRSYGGGTLISYLLHLDRLTSPQRHRDHLMSRKCIDHT